MFLLRKILVYLARPLSFLVILALLLGLRRRSRVCLLFAVLVYLMGISPVADLVVKPLERSFGGGEVAVSEPVKTVVVLSGGVFSREDAISSLGCSSVKRLLAALYLCRALGSCKLIVSGGSVLGSPVGAEVMGRVARAVEDITVIRESFSRTTYENALYVKRLVGDMPFYLVTSAYHMRRALMLFRHLGMKPIPYPSDYLSEERYTLADFFPQGRNIRKIELALHEYLAIAYYKAFLFRK